MPEKEDTIFLHVANEIVLALQNDPAHKSLPEDSWRISFEVDKTTLTFNITLQYEIFFRESWHMIADPALWISNVGLYAGRAFTKHVLHLPPNSRIAFHVNGHGQEKDWNTGCSIVNLVNAVNQKYSIQGTDISVDARIMAIMDTDSA